MTQGLRRCTRCVLPETHHTITFDEWGVCNVCRQNEIKQEKIDWAERKKELDRLIEEARGRGDYDVIIPFSGGKDSTFQVYYLVKEYGIKPLLVRFDHCFLRDTLHENTRRVIRELGVDLHVFIPNWKVTQKLMLESFLDKGDFCWHCHTGIFGYPMRVAINHQVPLILWGEPSAEYTGYFKYDQFEEVDENRFNRSTNLGISAEDMYVRLGRSVDVRDLRPYTYPLRKDLGKLRCRSVCLGSFIPWDVRSQYATIAKELGWKGDEVENVPKGYEYEKIECFLQGVRDYIKYIKRGYSRTAHLATIDIRHGRLTREEAMKLVNENEGYRPPSLDIFLEYIGLREDEFMEVAMSHMVSPYQHDPALVKPGRKTHDFDRWPRYTPMPRDYAEERLNKWRRARKTA